jgi:AcrR family transcriptional regulator
MPRRSATAVADTRANVLDAAVQRASIDGLEGLTIGRLAEETSMSKSGLHGLFGSKEELQVATFEKAVEGFVREVWLPVANQPRGLPRLEALLDRWIGYHERGLLAGGCFVTTATIEFDAKPGPLRDAVRRARDQMHAVLEADIRTAIDAGDLPPTIDAKDTAFALYALASAASQAMQLDEPHAAERARRCMSAVCPGYRSAFGPTTPRSTT